MQAIQARVFFDGFELHPRLSHPEGVAVHRDGSIWCGSENGSIFRIEPDGSSAKVVAKIDEFVLGIAFDNEGWIYVCGLGHGAVYRIDPNSGKSTRLLPAGQGPKTPNYLVVDSKRDRLLVTDSQRLDNPQPPIWEICLRTGEASPWLTEPFDFANGLALQYSEEALYVAVSWDKTIRRVEILKDGSAGDSRIWCDELPGIPDGLAFAGSGLLVGMYEPSMIIRVGPKMEKSVLLHDETAHLMCHPTNLAFRGSDLFTANLGRWHITQIETDFKGPISSFPDDLADVS